MRILGVDPALTITGYGAIEYRKGKLFLIEAGIIKTDPRQDLTLRLNKIYRGVSKLIQDTRPDVLVLEKLYAHYRHPTTAYILGQARGVICLVCAQEKISLVEYAATRVKKAIVGNGLASKAQVQRMIVSLFGLDGFPKYTDVSDALGLAVSHSYIAGKKYLK